MSKSVLDFQIATITATVTVLMEEFDCDFGTALHVAILIDAATKEAQTVVEAFPETTSPPPNDYRKDTTDE